MILSPTTDRDCLGQLTQMARELVPTTLVQTVAVRLGSPSKVLAWLQSLPQTDDDGQESFRAIACDVPQRTRLFPDDPNCFERSFAALALLEVLEPETARMLVTVERPLRHTGVVERRGRRWIALDLFPRRNANASETGKDILQGIHRYIGKPLLSFYGLGAVADQVGDAEDAAMGRAKKQPTPSEAAQRRPGADRQATQPTQGGADDEEEARTKTRAGQSASGTNLAGRISAVAGSSPPVAEAMEERREEEGSKRWGWG